MDRIESANVPNLLKNTAVISQVETSTIHSTRNEDYGVLIQGYTDQQGPKPAIRLWL